MTEVLGYPKFIAAGGDMGSVIAMSLSQRHPEKLLGYHVTDVGYPDHTTDFAALSGPEQVYAGALQQWFFQHPRDGSVRLSDDPQTGIGRDSEVGVSQYQGQPVGLTHGQVDQAGSAAVTSRP